MPILSKASWAGQGFRGDDARSHHGFGPLCDRGPSRPGETITYAKNPDYWGKDLPLQKGLWNFDEVRFDYYRDANAAFEAFKSGIADVRIEGDPVRWNTGYDFPAAEGGQDHAARRSSRNRLHPRRASSSTHGARFSRTRACARRW